MNIQEQIEAAFSNTTDAALYTQAALLRDNHGGARLIYTLLLRIRELEKQVEQERWRDATKEKPENDDSVWIVDMKAKVHPVERGFMCSDSNKFIAVDTYDCVNPTHWKHINLPA